MKPLTWTTVLRAGLLWLATMPAHLLAQGMAGPQCADDEGTLLWEVQGPALSQQGGSLHLFGSIHVGKPEFYPLPARIEALLREADQLVFEVNPEVAADPRVAMQMQLRGMLPAGQTLESVVSAETLRELEVVLQSLGLPLQNFLNYKPWMLALLLTNIQATRLGFDPLWGLESYLLQRRQPGTPILELESWQQQLDMLESIDPALFLDYSLEEFEAGAELIDTMVEAWLCGDGETLEEAVLSGSMELDPGIYDAMFVRRNRVMADGVAELARQGNADWLVVVGAGHLLGEDSVVTLLQDAGFSVRPVPMRASPQAALP